jgi:YVTN family beta-propeller protein
MFIKGVGLLIISGLVLLTGCQSMVSPLKSPLEDEGEILLYVQPFPQEADRFRFKIEGISAHRSDGVEFPLSLRLSQVKGREMTRQRLLGDVRLPPGFFSGLSVKVAAAFVRTEEGEASLLVPDGPVKIDFPFTVSARKGQLISMTFRPAESMLTSFAFSPVFVAFFPPKPLTGLIGYATSSRENNVTVFDKMTGQAAAVIPTGGGPAGMVLDQKGLRAYVALPDADTVEVIDVQVGAVIDRVRLNLGDRPRELALSPDRKTLLVVNAGSNTVSVLDPVSLRESARITVGNGPNSILLDPSGRRAYVFNTLSGTVSILDVANRAVVSTIAVDSGPLRGQFNRLGDKFYIIHEWSPYLSVVDARSLAVKRTSVGMGMASVKVDTNTDLVYLGKRREALVGVYDPLSFVPVDFIRTGTGITYLTIDGELNNLVMVGTEAATVMIVNLISRKTLAVVDVGEGPHWVTIMGER